jgi:hypothetical protein
MNLFYVTFRKILSSNQEKPSPNPAVPDVTSRPTPFIVIVKVHLSRSIAAVIRPSSNAEKLMYLWDLLRRCLKI